MPDREQVARASPDVTADRQSALADLYPEAFVDGAPDLEELAAALGIEGDHKTERFSFAWAGKRTATELLQMPSRATLVQIASKSLGLPDTSNVFIEGENLEVLKLLYRAYFGGVKLIYIDPPYNTGKDFVYKDNYTILSRHTSS